MKLLIKSIIACAWLASLPTWAQETNGCPAGSYSIILFDKFTLESSGTTGSGSTGSGSTGSVKPRKVCRISAPLNLPTNQSIGVYKVDYRGFAKLVKKQETDLEVQYFLGPQGNDRGRVFKRKVKGPYEGDYVFTETIGAGQMKRVGCGTAAVLNVGITLALDGDLRTGEPMASLDTTDAARGALVYHLDLKPCS
jgi:hypothetical protein